VIFGIGMSLLLRDSQSLSDFVGVVVLLTGACFAPLVTLKLVHFAADSQLAGEMVGTLRAGAQPTIDKVSHAHAPGRARSHMAKDYASGQSKSTARGGEAVSTSGAAGAKPGAAADAGGAPATGASAGSAGSSAAAGGGAKAASAAGPVGAAVAVGATAGTAAVKKSKEVGIRGGESMARLAQSAGDEPPRPTSPGPPTHEER